MMEPVFRKKFLNEYELAERRGKDMVKIKDLMKDLIEEKLLPPQNRDHPLFGDYTGYRECHIEPDWLIIYKRDKPFIIFYRTGTHSDLF